MNLSGQFDKQQGITLTGMLFWSIILVFAVLLGLKVAPVYLENIAIKRNLDAVADDASLRSASANEIRQAFSKRAQIDGIETITAKDIQVTRDNGRNQLSALYTVKVPLFANISLQIDFDTKSD